MNIHFANRWFLELTVQIFWCKLYKLWKSFLDLTALYFGVWCTLCGDLLREWNWIEPCPYERVHFISEVSGIPSSKSSCCSLPGPCSRGRQFPSVRVVNNYATVVIMVLQQYILLFLLLKCISVGYLVLNKTEESIRNVPFSASAGEAKLPASLGLHVYSTSQRPEGVSFYINSEEYHPHFSLVLCPQRTRNPCVLPTSQGWDWRGEMENKK